MLELGFDGRIGDINETPDSGISACMYPIGPRFGIGIVLQRKKMMHDIPGAEHFNIIAETVAVVPFFDQRLLVFCIIDFQKLIDFP